METDPQESVKQAVEAAMRALAEDNNISLQDVTDVIGTDDALRGAADRYASWRRYHDRGIHLRFEPNNFEAKTAFHLLEQLRCEVLAAQRMRGVAHNMAFSVLQEISDNPSIASTATATEISRAISKAVRDALEHALVK